MCVSFEHGARTFFVRWACRFFVAAISRFTFAADCLIRLSALSEATSHDSRLCFAKHLTIIGDAAYLRAVNELFVSLKNRHGYTK